ncbi:hypothetical protein EDC96DRAFT_549967 [Choanephora cucurbitarum]|nr:hypothetical protein EDC96DRAFT_549967 [Choanephora cucurbitarum]
MQIVHYSPEHLVTTAFLLQVFLFYTCTDSMHYNYMCLDRSKRYKSLFTLFMNLLSDSNMPYVWFVLLVTNLVSSSESLPNLYEEEEEYGGFSSHTVCQTSEHTHVDLNGPVNHMVFVPPLS